MPEGGHRRGPPPWWPEGEQWPPRQGSSAEAWGGWGRGVFFRVALLLGALLLLAAVAGATAWWFLGEGHRGRWFPWMIFPLLFVAFFIMVGRGFRRTWWPVRSLVDATGRLADGDYEVRVEPAGPPPLQEAMRSFNRMAGQLEQSDERRRRLLADLSHELRTPLTVIQASLEALVDGVYPPDRDHLLPLIEETKVMGRLLDDLRTLSLAEAGRLQLHREPTDLADLVSDVLASFRATAEEQDVEVAPELDADLPEIELDPVRIRGVVTNLVVNALRAMPDGGRLRVGIAAEAAGRRVWVADTGKGIEPELLPHVFDRFVKSPDSGGTGLGLTIARDLVEAHGGTISATSRPGEGTEIVFILPA